LLNALRGTQAAGAAIKPGRRGIAQGPARKPRPAAECGIMIGEPGCARPSQEVLVFGVGR
jgi:hypothetical protein